MTERPTAAQIRRAKKAELVAWCESFGLNAEGKVDDLRERLLEHLDTPAKEEAPAAEPEETPAEKAEEKPGAEAEAAEPEVEEGEEGEGEAYTPKPKPQFDPTIRRMLEVRREIARRRPRFLRQEWFRYRRLGEKWRKPMGGQTKLRRHYGYRPNVVSIGYRGPKAVRGLHPSGFREVLVRSARDLERINPKVEAARIAGTVGMRRRTEIQAAADEKGIRVLNRRGEE